MCFTLGRMADFAVRNDAFNRHARRGIISTPDVGISRKCHDSLRFRSAGEKRALSALR
jgi:hypothetical protein